MDSYTAATTPPAEKIRRCSCGRRMSSLLHDSHSISVVCRGIDCDADHHCPECTDVDDSVMSKYVAHRISLQRKLQTKRSKKDTVPIPAVAVVAAESAVAEPSALPVLASVSQRFLPLI